MGSCENCKYWVDYGQISGKCSEIIDRVVSEENSLPDYLITDYNFGCNLFKSKIEKIFLMCIKNLDYYEKGTIYKVPMSKEYFDRNVELHEYFEFDSYVD